MGLFEKKECALCGGKAGLLTRHKIQGGAYICGDCRAKMSPNTSGISDLSLDDVKEQIARKEENDRRFNEEFNMTRVVMIDNKHQIMGVDEAAGEFAILTDNKPDIFRFDQILSFNTDLSTSTMSEEEKKKKEGWAGLLDFLLSDDFGIVLLAVVQHIIKFFNELSFVFRGNDDGVVVVGDFWDAADGGGHHWCAGAERL